MQASPVFAVEMKLNVTGYCVVTVRIKVTSQTHISFEEYRKYFVYKIYECYKPTNLIQTREYLEYMTSLDNNKALSQDLEDYLETE